MKIALLTEVLKNLLKKPATVEYPKVPTEIEADARGLHAVDAAKCIGCGLCARECPTGAIKMEKFPFKERPLPVIDITYCIFCYHCVFVCPVKAYKTSSYYHLATSNKAELLHEPTPPEQQKATSKKG